MCKDWLRLRCGGFPAHDCYPDGAFPLSVGTHTHASTLAFQKPLKTAACNSLIRLGPRLAFLAFSKLAVFGPEYRTPHSTLVSWFGGGDGCRSHSRRLNFAQPSLEKSALAVIGDQRERLQVALRRFD